MSSIACPVLKEGIPAWRTWHWLVRVAIFKNRTEQKAPILTMARKYDCSILAKTTGPSIFTGKVTIWWERHLWAEPQLLSWI